MKTRGAPDSLASATSQFFDGFDFQSIDSNTHLLFMAHTGTAAFIGIGGYVANGSAFSIGPFTIAAESVDIGTLILFLTFLKLLYQPMRDLSKLATLANTAGSGAERIQEVLDQAPEVKESPIPGPYTGPQRFRGEITFENVWMSYVAA